MCEMLLSKGADIFTIDDSGNTLLHVAHAKGHKDVCAWLLSNGLDASLRNNEDKTYLKVTKRGKRKARKVTAPEGAAGGSSSVVPSEVPAQEALGKRKREDIASSDRLYADLEKEKKKASVARADLETAELNIQQLLSEIPVALKQEADALDKEVEAAEANLREVREAAEANVREARDRALQAKKKVAEAEAASAGVEIHSVRTTAVIQDKGGSNVQNSASSGIRNESAPAMNESGGGARSTTDVPEDRGGGSAHVPAERRLDSIDHSSIRNETVCKREQPKGW